MMTDLKIRKFLFKAKTQLTNSSSGQRENEQHITEIDGRMHSENVKIVDLIGEHIQTK